MILYDLSADRKNRIANRSCSLGDSMNKKYAVVEEREQRSLHPKHPKISKLPKPLRKFRHPAASARAGPRVISQGAAQAHGLIHAAQSEAVAGPVIKGLHSINS